jgi:8-oxo-dGTP pyrophosphatase MutT (NUDIX family)
MSTPDSRIIRAALRAPLPGKTAQMRMAPRPRRLTPLDEDTPRDAGVLCLLYPRAADTVVVLTRRSDGLERHSAQISFPGGAREAGETIVQTALRETQEELGVSAENIEILGELTPLYVSVSNFLIHPVVGWADPAPRFRPDPREVAEVLEVSVQILVSPATTVTETWHYHGADHEVPFFSVKGNTVWGATAMILSELLEVLRQAETL